MVSKSNFSGKPNPSSIQEASLSAARTSALAPIVSATSPIAGTLCSGESEIRSQAIPIIPDDGCSLVTVISFFSNEFLILASAQIT